MAIHLICIGQRMPAWVDSGFAEYAKRLPRPWQIQLTELPPAKRGKNADIARCRRQEGERMCALLNRDTLTVALDEHGKLWDTAQLAANLQSWLAQAASVALLVGGPDGLDRGCLARADHCWSLSPLTLPHALVRVVVAEQIYRAWSLAHQHPYHRA